MSFRTALIFDLYKVNATSIDDAGFIGIQPDWYGEEGGPEAENATPYGFWSRPLDPDVDGEGSIANGASVLVAREGGKALAFPLSDPRITEKLPPLKKGESVQYGPAANFFRCHADGALSMFTTADGTPTGPTVYFRSATDGLTYEAPWGRLRYDATGFHVRTHAGASIDAGGFAAPAPLDTLSSYYKVRASSASLEASVVRLGPTTLPTEPAAKATTLYVLLNSITASLNSISAALTAMGLPGGMTSATGGPVSAAAAAGNIASAATACASAAAAVTGALLTLPSSSTQVV